jgi:ferredoxin
MLRKIIKIDEILCNGCGQCAGGCPEGAIQMINGKARLVGEIFCDGLGACIGTCPQGAITVEEREAVPYDEERTMENIAKAGPETIAAHLKHLENHGQKGYLKQALEYIKEHNIELPKKHKEGCGCPHSQSQTLHQSKKRQAPENVTLASELEQWPIQLKLVNPHAPYFDGAELVIAADCVPFAYPDFHRHFLKGKRLVIFCPKLDGGLEEYVEKLAELFAAQKIKSLSLVHMQVPCCFGLRMLAQQALEKSGVQIPTTDYTISLEGEIIKEEKL